MLVRSHKRVALVRVETFSSLSSVIFPLYNYDRSNGKPLALYIGFEQDGGLYGYSGCDDDAYAFEVLEFKRLDGKPFIMSNK